MQNVFTLETNKYEIKIENFEGPLDLLCHLIEKNKLNICEVKISEITDQYIDYINNMEEMNLEVTSEFLIMASTLLYLKSKTLLPKDNEEEEELTEEELLKRIIDYKKYKEVSLKLKDRYLEYSKRTFKNPDVIELPKQQLDRTYDKSIISELYSNVINKNKNRINKNAQNIQKIAITDTYTVGSKVKDMYRELVRNKKFVFNRLFSLKKHNKNEVVTAFSGLLEMSRRSKVLTEQNELFGDISVTKNRN
ncbi:MAG: chromosome segregation protein ScpA [Clostridiales bacterium]|nr:chromosome segregation protein ScpA [Clostridiales bacterium]